MMVGNPDLPDPAAGYGDSEPRGLVPVSGSTGEWHDVPIGEEHTFTDCVCNPQLRVANNEAGDLRSVWVHRSRTAH